MRRFVDNTYLLSVGSCLRGDARNEKQISTFLRFVGELVGAETICFTGDIRGPVYPATKQSVDDICAILGNDDWIRYAELDEENFISATYKAAQHLIRDMTQFDPGAAFAEADLRPSLSAVTELDQELHGYLINPRYSEMTSRYAAPRTSNFAGFVLSREPVREALDQRLNGRPLTLDATVLLGIAVRMLAYDEFAQALRATYLPSTARAELWILPATVETQLLAIQHQSENYPAALEDKKISDLTGIVDALVRVSRGKPSEILRQAWLLRSATGKVRSTFKRLEKRGDAVILKANNLAEEYRGIIDQLLGKKPKPQFANALFKTVSLTFGVSGTGISMTPNINDAPLREWWSYKCRKRHVHALAVLAAKAERLDNDEGYRNLLVSASGNTLP